MNKEEVLEIYILARWSYKVGKPIYTNNEYTEIEKCFRQFYPKHELLTYAWSFDKCPTDLLKKYNLENLIEEDNIDDSPIIYNTESMQSARTEEEYNILFSTLNKRTTVSYKIDGWNTQVHYRNGKPLSANLRGRGKTDKVNFNFIFNILPKTIDILDDVTIIGETSIPNNRWEEFKMITGNSDQRSSVSSAIARGEEYFLSFLAFNIIIHGKQVDGIKFKKLEELGFKTPMYFIVDNFKSLDMAIKRLCKLKNSYGYLTDGIVVENDTLQYAVRIYDYQEKYFSSYVTGYVQKHSVYGLSTVVSIYPTFVSDGKKVTEVDVSNLNRVIKYNLRIGYPICFNLRSQANCVLNVIETSKLQDEVSDLDKYRKDVENSYENHMKFIS